MSTCIKLLNLLCFHENCHCLSPLTHSFVHRMALRVYQRVITLHEAGTLSFTKPVLSGWQLKVHCCSLLWIILDLFARHTEGLRGLRKLRRVCVVSPTLTWPRSLNKGDVCLDVHGCLTIHCTIQYKAFGSKRMLSWISELLFGLFTWTVAYICGCFSFKPISLYLSVVISCCCCVQSSAEKSLEAARWTTSVFHLKNNTYEKVECAEN